MQSAHDGLLSTRPSRLPLLGTPLVMPGPAGPGTPVMEQLVEQAPSQQGVVLVLVAVAAIVWNRTTVTGTAIDSVAVMPLMADSVAGDYDVADGITDSIINNLSLVPRLRVISHASVFQYRGQNVDPRSIGQKLGVAAVLTGRVLQIGPNISVNLELTATADGRRLWGQQYTRNLSLIHI